MAGPQADIERVHAIVAGARRITALTGAGISTDSGIPDFRGPNGVWTKDPKAERASTLSAYLADPAVRRHAWRTRVASPAWSAQPNAGHRALVALERQGRLRALVTQNIDGLHQKAGSSDGIVIEVHGSIRGWVCWSCGATGPMEEMLVRARAGEEDPACPVDGGIVKSTTISFGQSLDREVLAAAEVAAQTCDLLLAVGTSLGVHPAAGLVPVAALHGAEVVILNAEPTPYDHIADAVVRGSIGEILPRLVAPA